MKNVSLNPKEKVVGILLRMSNEKLKMKEGQLALAIGLSAASYSKIVNFKQRPSAHEYELIADHFHISIDLLMGRNCPYCNNAYTELRNEPDVKKYARAILEFSPIQHCIISLMRYFACIIE